MNADLVITMEEEIRAIAPVVNIRVLEGAEIPSLYTRVEREREDGFRRSESLMNPVGEIKLTSPQKLELHRGVRVGRGGPREDP